MTIIFRSHKRQKAANSHLKLDIEKEQNAEDCWAEPFEKCRYIKLHTHMAGLKIRPLIGGMNLNPTKGSLINSNTAELRYYEMKHNKEHQAVHKHIHKGIVWFWLWMGVRFVTAFEVQWESERASEKEREV